MSDLTLLTYNVLADAYIRPEYYTHIEPKFLDVTWRRPALVKHIQRRDADIICLQEVEQELFEVLSDALAPTHTATYASKGNHKPDGCATLFRSDLFHLVSEHPLYYSDGSGHVALVTALESGDRTLTIANTHVRWDPPEKRGRDHVGYRQIEELLAHVREDSPLMVCGDLNARPGSDAIALLRDHGLIDAYGNDDSAFTSNVNEECKRIDYVFHSPSLTSVAAPLPTIHAKTPLPNAEQPSDHLALRVHLRW